MGFEKKKYIANRKEKLFLFLMKKMNISQAEAQRIIDKGRVFAGGNVIKDKSAYIKGEIEIIEFVPKSMGLYPLFLNPEFAVFDKPSGVLSHPKKRAEEITLIDEAKYLFGKNANIVHRLDKETSGVILVSLNKKCEKELKRNFELKKIKKGYLSLVKGIIEKEMTIDVPIMKNKDFSQIRLKVLTKSGGKEAVTKIIPLEIFGNNTLIEAIPLTGRQHQIRAHLFHVKHSVVGDPIYGVSAFISSKYPYL